MDGGDGGVVGGAVGLRYCDGRLDGVADEGELVGAVGAEPLGLEGGFHDEVAVGRVLALGRLFGPAYEDVAVVEDLVVSASGSETADSEGMVVVLFDCDFLVLLVDCQEHPAGEVVGGWLSINAFCIIQ